MQRASSALREGRVLKICQIVWRRGGKVKAIGHEHQAAAHDADDLGVVGIGPPGSRTGAVRTSTRRAIRVYLHRLREGGR
jgi:hypothetical protein